MRFHTAFGLEIEQLDIVLIDDHEHSRNITETMLKAFRTARVRSFKCPITALAAMHKDPANLLITDWLKPSDDIAPFIKNLRHADNDPLSHIPIVILSAKQTSRKKEQEFDEVNAFAKKPQSPESLYKCLIDVTKDRRRLYRLGDHYAIEKSATTAGHKISDQASISI